MALNPCQNFKFDSHRWKVSWLNSTMRYLASWHFWAVHLHLNTPVIEFSCGARVRVICIWVSCVAIIILKSIDNEFEKNPQPSLFMHHHSLQKLKRSLYLRFITFRIVHHHTSEDYHRSQRGTCEELKQREGNVKLGRFRLKHLLSFCSEKRNLSGLKVFLKEGR